MADEELPSYTPQHVQDILPIYADAASPLETYTLIQNGPSTQVLRLQSHGPEASNDGTTYFVKTFATGGFMNKKPHVVISKIVDDPPPIDGDDTRPQPPPRRRSLFRRSPSPPKESSSSPAAAKASPAVTCAEARFDIHGTGTSISYLAPPPSAASSASNQSNTPRVPQRLELTNSSLQILRTTVGREIYYWQEHPGNRSVYELVDESEELLARFVYLNIPWLVGSSSAGGSGPRRSSSTTDAAVATNPGQPAGGAGEGAGDAGKKSKDNEYEIGRLELVGSKIRGQAEREQTLCSALVVIERAKRRAVNLGLYNGGGANGKGVGAGDLGGPRIRGYS